ncbi:MAG: hypothetical protein IJ787_00870 [Bacilli bacterium]|nr:hypothetical protein [Bacilli bacterium]
MSRIIEGIYCYDEVDRVVQKTESITMDESQALEEAQDYLGLERYDDQRGFVSGGSFSGEGTEGSLKVRVYRHTIDAQGRHIYAINCNRPSSRGANLRGTGEMKHYLIASEALPCRGFDAFDERPLSGVQDFPVAHDELPPLPEVRADQYQRSAFDLDSFAQDIDNMIAFTATYEKAKKSGHPMVVYYVPSQYENFVKSLRAWMSFLPAEEEKSLSFATLVATPRPGYQVLGIPREKIDSVDLSDIGDYVGLKYPADEFEWRDTKQGGDLVKLLRRAADNAEILQELMEHAERLGKKISDLEQLGSLASTILLLDRDPTGLEQLEIGKKGTLERDYLHLILDNLRTINATFRRFPRQALEYLKVVHVANDGNYSRLFQDIRNDIFLSLWKLYNGIHDDMSKIQVQDFLHGMLFRKGSDYSDEGELAYRANLLQMQLVNPEAKAFFQETEMDYLLDNPEEFESFLAFARRWLSAHASHADALVDYIADITDRLFGSIASLDDEVRIFGLLNLAKLAKTTWTFTIETIFEKNNLDEARRLEFFFQYVASLKTEAERADIVEEAVAYFKKRGMIPTVIASLTTVVFFGGDEGAKKDILEEAFAIYLDLPERKVKNFADLASSLQKIDELDLEKTGKDALTKYYASTYFHEFDPKIVRELDLKIYTTDGKPTFERLIVLLREANRHEKAKEIQEQIDLREPEIQRHDTAIKNESDIFEFRKESVLTTFRSLSIDRMKEVVLHFVDRGAFKSLVTMKVDTSMKGGEALAPSTEESPLEINEGEDKVPVASVQVRAKPREKDRNYVEAACLELASRILSVDGEVSWNDRMQERAKDRFALRREFAQLTLEKKMEERAALAALRDVGHRIAFAFIHAIITGVLTIVGSAASRTWITAGSYYAFYVSFVLMGAGFMWVIAFMNYKTIWGKKMRPITIIEDILMAGLLIGLYILCFVYVF